VAACFASVSVQRSTAIRAREEDDEAFVEAATSGDSGASMATVLGRAFLSAPSMVRRRRSGPALGSIRANGS
jgi:hypothetical protein